MILGYKKHRSDMTKDDLRMWMDEHKLTLKDAAEKIRLSESRVKDYLKGKSPIPLRVAMAIDYYDVMIELYKLQKRYKTLETKHQKLSKEMEAIKITQEKQKKTAYDKDEARWNRARHISEKFNVPVDGDRIVVDTFC